AEVGFDLFTGTAFPVTPNHAAVPVLDAGKVRPSITVEVAGRRSVYIHIVEIIRGRVPRRVRRHPEFEMVVGVNGEIAVTITVVIGWNWRRIYVTSIADSFPKNDSGKINDEIRADEAVLAWILTDVYLIEL